MNSTDHLHNERNGLKGGRFVYTRKHACEHTTGTYMTGCSAGPATDRAPALILAHDLRIVNLQ